ncbi:hypothetical protein AVEN_121084-1 [Araneus ventricosus]|uniref:Uncharacterized protein n=1 Tax=Araneus ventricosus TaxID=182803 RepID=A0A4Y2JX42_ARAVE|nr:hypothetical protein AVEN_121084-1 [Araneus ventricosus]
MSCIYTSSSAEEMENHVPGFCYTRHYLFQGRYLHRTIAAAMENLVPGFCPTRQCLFQGRCACRSWLPCIMYSAAEYPVFTKVPAPIRKHFMAWHIFVPHIIETWSSSSFS